MNTNRHRFGLFLCFWTIVIGAIILRFPGLFGEVSYYEKFTMSRVASNLDFDVRISLLDFSFFKQAFYYKFSAWETSIFGIDVFPLRLTSLVFAVFSLFFAYKLGEKLFSKEDGLIFAGLVAFCDSFVSVGSNARCYSMLICFTLLASWMFSRIVDPIKAKSVRGVWTEYVVYASSMIIMIYLHFLGFAIFSIHVAIALILVFFANQRRLILWLTTTIVVVSLTYLPFVKYALMGLQVVRGHGDEIYGAKEYAKLTLAVDYTSASVGLVIATLVFCIIKVIWGLNSLAFSEFFAMGDTEDTAKEKRNIFIISCLLTVYSLPIVLYFLFGIFFPKTLTLRYLFPFTLAFLLLFAHSIGLILRRRMALVFIVLLTGFGLSVRQLEFSNSLAKVSSFYDKHLSIALIGKKTMRN